MQISFLILCLTAHIVGEYYLQDSDFLSLNKSKISSFTKNSLLYSIPFGIVFIVLQKSFKLLFMLLLIFLSHLLVNIILEGYNRYLNSKKNNKVKSRIKPWVIYIVKQLFYIIFIIIILINSGANKYNPIFLINYSFNMLGISKDIFIKWTFIVLCMHKPVNTTFKILFANSKPIEKSQNYNNNGAIIGFLERIIIVILISLNQYSAIGFILTAKSVARYNKISEDAEFGEYYLIGTLYSTLFAIVLYNIIF